MKTIAIVAGGDSSEYEVSIRSAQGLFNFIDKSRYRIYIVVIRGRKWTVLLPINGTILPGVIPDSLFEIDKNDFSFQLEGEKIQFDYAYITIHGRPGEDGRLQGYFDLLGIPYSSSGVLTGALTFNKFINNQFLKTQGVRVADATLLRKKGKIGEIEFPVFVKPNEGGSSLGVTKVKEASQLLSAIEKAFAESDEVIVEKFIQGTEVTCGCYKTKTKQVVLPVTEVVTENEFFDYNAKYNGQVLEITPARISDEQTSIIQQETLRIYDLVGARGIIRIDYIIPADGLPVLLEINTNPGMTETSFIPQQIRAAGLDIKDVMTDVIEDV